MDSNITLTPTRLEIMKLLRRYPVLRNGQIRDRVRSHDKDGSITRADLRKLGLANWIRKYQPKITLGNGSAPPVYTLTVNGAAALAAVTGDARYLLQAEVSFANWVSVNHMVALSALAMVIDDAFAREKDAKLLSMHFESDVVDASAKTPSEKYFLHTTVGEKCYFVPDMAIETAWKGHVRATFFEYETGAEHSPARVAAKKHRGIEGFGNGDHLAKMFPAAQGFRVMFIAPWRDALRNEFKDKKAKKWALFCSTLDVTSEKFLHEPILYTVETGPFAFLPDAPAGTPAAEREEERPPEPALRWNLDR